MRFVVLGGAGAMGQVIVHDLFLSAAVKEVVVADFNKDKAEGLKIALGGGKLSAAFADITDRASLVPVLKGATAVINSTPYYHNINVMQAALEAGCHYIDLGGLFHITRRQLELDEQFKDRGLLAVLGMGAAPGMTNIMAAHAVSRLERVDSIDIAIGCVDFAEVDHPMYPPYSLDTILDEYTKEPMVFEDGQFAARPPMSGEVEVDFPEPVGTARAILTLHSEVATLPVTYRDKGIRRVTFRLGLPVDFHEKLKFLVDIGLGSPEAVLLPEGPAVPRQVLAHLLGKFPMPSGEPDDCEVVRVDVAGSRSGKDSLVRMEATVRSHPEWKISCGALDTGVPPSIVAQMIGSGTITETGVLPPESCVPPEPFFQELARRTMVVQEMVF